jgi:hypothetical protein
MTDLRKAAEMGLEALEANLGKWAAKTPAIEALRQALAQPEREWVGLTDEEVESWRGNYDFFNSALVREVEAKLKEKNSGAS